MTSEARPRKNPIVNPEHAVEALRRLVRALDLGEADNRREAELRAATAAARRVLGVQGRIPAQAARP